MSNWTQSVSFTLDEWLTSLQSGPTSDFTLTAKSYSVKGADGSFQTFFGNFKTKSTELITISKYIWSEGRNGADPYLQIDKLKNIPFHSFAPELFNFDGNDRFIGGNGADYQTLAFAGKGDDLIDGRDGDDIIVRTPGRDRHLGGNGDDMIYLGDGADTATGGAGRDIFVLSQDSVGGTITDFRKADDQLWLETAALFEGFDANSSDITDFARLSGKGKKVTLLIDRDGGGDDFDAHLSIRGDIGTDLTGLIDSGVIVIA